MKNHRKDSLQQQLVALGVVDLNRPESITVRILPACIQTSFLNDEIRHLLEGHKISPLVAGHILDQPLPLRKRWTAGNWFHGDSDNGGAIDHSVHRSADHAEGWFIQVVFSCVF
jgi:hypothetical protein